MDSNEGMVHPEEGVIQVPESGGNVGSDKDPISFARSVLEAIEGNEELREAFAAMLLDTKTFKKARASDLEGIVGY